MDWHTNTHGDLSCTWRDGPFTLTATVKNDDDGDISWLGDFSDDSRAVRFANLDLESEFREVMHNRRIPESRWPRGFRSGDSYADCTGEEALANIKQDAKRYLDWLLDEWHFVYVSVTASLDGVELGSDSLSDIESDSGEEYFTEVAQDCAIEALTETRAKLVRLAEAACAAGLFPVAPMYLASE